MNQQSKMKLMFWFTILYMLFFTIVALLNRNYEFLYYTIVMSVILLLLVIYRKRIAFSTGIAFWLTLLAAIHIFGGNIHISGIRLYDVWLFSWFKYDNLVHVIGGLVAGLLSYAFVYQYLDKEAKTNKTLFVIIILSMASGIGALNEVLELGAVVWLNASAQVGDYMNNALDLLYNLVGSVIACVYLLYMQNK